jgi:hypothetical protein
VLEPLGLVEGGDLERQLLVGRNQLLGSRQQRDPLVVEAVLGVFLGDEDVLVERRADLPERGVDVGQLEVRVEVLGVALEPRLEPLFGLGVALEDDQVFDGPLLVGALLPVTPLEPAFEYHRSSPKRVSAQDARSDLQGTPPDSGGDTGAGDRRGSL